MNLFIYFMGLFALGFTASIQGKVPKELIQSKGTSHLFEYESIKQNASWNKISVNTSTWLQFALGFAARSQWVSIAFFLPDSDLPLNLPPIIFKYFNADGKFVNVHSTSKSFLPLSVLHLDSRLGVVYYCEVPDEDFLNKVSELHLFDSYRTWLIIKPETEVGSTKLEDILVGLKFGVDVNMVVGSVERRTGPSTASLSSSTSTRNQQQNQNLNLQARRKRDLTCDITLVVRLVQIYKAAKTENETLNLNMGFWDVPNGLAKVKDLTLEESRWNLGGYKVHVGVKNTSQNHRTSLTSGANRFALDVEEDEEKNFHELLSCLINRINASFELVKFPKLGWRNEEGGWTHLLGGVVDETVDFALETIDVNVDKTGDMSFTHAIVTTMNNIYLHRPSTGGMRDIFLAPFSPKLVICVLITSFLLAVAMVSISVVYHRIGRIHDCVDTSLLLADVNTSSTSGDMKKWKISDAMLWSVSILCLQGGQWSPKSISGNLLLINGLLFALIIYNAFAAFITSVLSVTNVSIKDLKDLANSDYAFGYTLGNSDELFLRTVNNTLLRELYFKGLRENDGVSDPIEGMHRAANGKYAFFVAARIGRRALRTVVAHDKRCKFQELCLTATKNYASIPMARKSALKKIINLKVIKLMETGILRRFQKLILLTMPRCVERTTFNSAGLADVYSAFFVLGAGWVTSFIALVLEILWKKRKLIKTTRVKPCSQQRMAPRDLNHWYYNK